MELLGAQTVKKKSGALEKFIEPETETNEPQTAVRKRGQNGKRGITIRMNQTQWRRAKEAAMAEDISMAELFMLALSERLKAQRLPGMFEP
jgi:hypothetical protein